MAGLVNYLHTELNMLHRDLHNKNFLVNPDTNEIFLIDFSTALILGPGGYVEAGQPHHFPPMFCAPE